MNTVCVDLDGVLAHYDGWKGHDHIGLPISGAKRFCEALSGCCTVCIHTARMNNGSTINRDALGVVTEWLDRHGFEYDSIWTGPGKPLASAYIDDKAVVCRPGKDIENQDFDTALRLCRALVAGNALGAVGSYSHGALSEDDEGDLRLMVSRYDSTVRIDFGKPVHWIGMGKKDAKSFAQLLVKHAEKL